MATENKQQAAQPAWAYSWIEFKRPTDGKQRAATLAAVCKAVTTAVPQAPYDGFDYDFHTKKSRVYFYLPVGTEMPKPQVNGLSLPGFKWARRDEDPIPWQQIKSCAWPGTSDNDGSSVVKR